MPSYVQQSGSITPGHGVKWITDGVIGDNGATVVPTNVLATLLSADMNSISDQAITFPNTITAFQISGILVCNSSLSLTTAAGGFYPATSKTGTAIVAASQVYTTLTAAAKLLSLTLAAATATTRFSSANVDSVDGYLTIYFALTTAQGSAATADIYVLGTDLTA